MLLHHHQAPGYYQRPRNLGALISLYESNFTQVQHLIPDLPQLQGTVVSSVHGVHDLYLSIQQRSPYTTLIFLSYRFASQHQIAEEPNAHIRIYHDARTAELLGHSRKNLATRRTHSRYQRMPELERRWRLNRFLYKWLGFCQHQGHLFLSGMMDCPANPSGARAAS